MMIKPDDLESPDPEIQKQLRLHALYDMAVELSALRSLDSVLNTALTHCLNLTESEFGFIGLNTVDNRAMDVVAIQGFHPSEEFYWNNQRFPLRHNVFARSVLENRPVRSVDATTDPNRVGQPKGHPLVITFLGVPLRVFDVPIGMIGVANRPESYDDDHEQLLMTYAAQVAIVIRNAQLYEDLTDANTRLESQVRQRTQQLEEAKEALAEKAAILQKLLVDTVDVQERERQRIAQGMHDGISQLMIGAMLELKSARQRMLGGETERSEESLDAVQDILRRVDAELKHVIHDLRPPTLDELGLVPALRRYAVRYEQYSNVKCTVQVIGTHRRLTSSAEINIYRLIQEALNNVSTHASATTAHVTIHFDSDKIGATVLDNGNGFVLESALYSNEGHFGLLGMQERAEGLGGTLSIESTMGEGTAIALNIPMPMTDSAGNQATLNDNGIVQ
ncbi:MAG: GAF domain-containing sensor histidine kinase [Chloroflexota bacterium]